ncbi:unnamed protein product [Schistocephalus solidus]|uniref:N-acetylglucosaminylphosphatidylinositol deacetylase n=1 Tax=Schistocephalus solidus TaxID=70667 RepID=A0A183TSY0_SCHSO|nr:unnamed protein product [Schistocephalus solidus]
MPQLPNSAEYTALRITVNGAQLKNVETFAYLGSKLSRNTRIDDEVVNAPVATSSRYPTLTCGSLKLVLSSGHTPGNNHDWRAKPCEGLRCCVCLHTRSASQPTPNSPLPSPLLLRLLPLLSPFFHPLYLLSFTCTSSLLPLSSPFPPPPRSKMS